MTKHTPGEWKTSGQLIVTAQHYPHPNPKAQPSPKLLAEVHWDYDGDTPAGREPRIGWNEANANMRAMCAAPELLASLRAMLHRYLELVNSGDAGHWNPEGDDCVIAARAALLKAIGVLE